MLRAAGAALARCVAGGGAAGAGRQMQGDRMATHGLVGWVLQDWLWPTKAALWPLEGNGMMFLCVPSEIGWLPPSGLGYYV